MDKITFRKKEVPRTDIFVPIKRLAFYPENPRIYSRFAGTTDRTQENIQKMLEGMEHVKELRSQIDKDGDVNEHLYCIPIPKESELHGDFDYQVLEGNSRLAALRINKPTPPPITSVRCFILDFSNYSAKETESLIFSLLGQFHITVKTNWESYENAAYIYRRYKNQAVGLENIAKEIGKSKAKVQKMIEAFEMMMKAEDENRKHWSYYEAFVSSTKIKKYRKEYHDLDNRVVSLIKDEKFPRAMDMRDKLPDILGDKKARKIFFTEEETDPFEEALEIAQLSGNTDSTFKKVQRFRMDLATADTRKEIRKLLQNKNTEKKTKFELDKISRFVAELLKSRTTS